jgi:hypothetical protein
MRAIVAAFLVLAAALAAPGAARAWSNHGFMTYWALGETPEVANAPAVTAEPIEAFLRDQEAAIETLLAQQEDWARAHLQSYPPRPGELAFKADSSRDDGARKLAFLHALRVSANWRLALFVQAGPAVARDPARALPWSAVSTLREPGFSFLRFQKIEPGESVSALAVVSSSADEPDFGVDINCFDDNPSDWGKLYRFGKQPFGNPALDFSSQAPFHMGFFHQSAIIYRAAPFVARTYPLLRAHQFAGLADLAFRTGHSYWGWRFAANAMHYVQDLTQPYHSSLLPGVSTTRMIGVAIAAKLGWPRLQDEMTVLVSNRHLVLERYQSQMLFRPAADGRPAPILSALQAKAQDAAYGAWSENYVRDIVGAEAFEWGERLNDALLAAMPARYVSDSAFDFGARGGGVDLAGELAVGDPASRTKLEGLVVDLIGHFGAHSRNALRAILSGVKTAAQR